MILRKREVNGNLKKEVFDRTVCKNRFGSSYEPVVRETVGSG
jgi:hypothetical protein